MLRRFYNLLFPVVFLLLLPGYLRRMVRRGHYRQNFWQRLGFYSPAVHRRLAGLQGATWVQAVSVGEMIVALKCVAGLRAVYPTLPLVVSTTTTTGYALARERVPADVEVLYTPIDLRGAVRRFFDAVHPAALGHRGRRLVAQPTLGISPPPRASRPRQRPALPPLRTPFPPHALPRSRAFWPIGLGLCAGGNRPCTLAKPWRSLAEYRSTLAASNLMMPRRWIVAVLPLRLLPKLSQLPNATSSNVSAFTRAAQFSWLAAPIPARKKSSRKYSVVYAPGSRIFS